MITNIPDYTDKIDWRTRVFDSLSYPTLILRPDRTIIAANLRFYERIGNPGERILGRTCKEIFFGGKCGNEIPCDGANCTLDKCIRQKKAQSVILTDVDKNGNKTWEERVFSPILGDGGEVSYVIESLRDITKIKTLEKQYSDVRQLIDKVVQSSVSAIMAADRRGEIILMNKAAEDLFDYTVQDANKINIEDFYPPGVAREIMAELRDASYGEVGKLPITKINIVTRKGVEIPVEMTAAIIYEEGRETATAAIFNDLREKQAVQKKLEEAEMQLFQSEKLASLGRFAAGVAHEINNPLTSILLYGTLMQEKLEESNPLKENINYILEDAERCRDIVKNLLAYSRQTRPTKDLFYLNDLVAEGLRLIRDQKLFMHIDVVKELDDRKIAVNADKNQLCQVLINLIINALDAMDEGGTLTLKTYRDREKHKAFLEVSDTGSGIAPENRAKVFDPFFTTKELGKGTGLGLSMAYGILKENHGRISIKKTDPEGTTVLLELPEQNLSDKSLVVSIG